MRLNPKPGSAQSMHLCQLPRQKPLLRQCCCPRRPSACQLLLQRTALHEAARDGLLQMALGQLKVLLRLSARDVLSKRDPGTYEVSPMRGSGPTHGP